MKSGTTLSPPRAALLIVSFSSSSSSSLLLSSVLGGVLFLGSVPYNLMAEPLAGNLGPPSYWPLFHRAS